MSARADEVDSGDEHSTDDESQDFAAYLFHNIALTTPFFNDGGISVDAGHGIIRRIEKTVEAKSMDSHAQRLHLCTQECLLGNRYKTLAWLMSLHCHHVCLLTRQIPVALKTVASFLMKSSVDAFFSCLVGPLQEPEHQLRNAIIDFLQRWPAQEYATYFDLRFDPEVASEDFFLPAYLCQLGWRNAYQAKLHCA